MLYGDCGIEVPIIILLRSKELRELIGRMEHQSPHLLDTMEQVISFLHADWQQLKRDCDNLHSKLKRWVSCCVIMVTP